MSSLAQEESRSISENCTWGQRKRFQDGRVTVPFERFLGYDSGEDGNLVLNEDEAKNIRRIYGLFLRGRSPYAIAKVLTTEGIPTPGGKKVWSASTVKSILTNEKYKDDVLLQKVYTEDFLSKTKIKNDGQVSQYYVENKHPAIIEPAVFDKVQKLMVVRHPGQNRNSSISPFSSRIKCGKCGCCYGSKVWHSNDKYRKVIWQCNNKFDGDCKCETPHITEAEIKELFIKAMNILITEKDDLIADFDVIKDTVFDTSTLTQERAGLQAEMNMVAEQIEQCALPKTPASHRTKTTTENATTTSLNGLTAPKPVSKMWNSRFPKSRLTGKWSSSSSRNLPSRMPLRNSPMNFGTA